MHKLKIKKKIWAPSFKANFPSSPSFDQKSGSTIFRYSSLVSKKVFFNSVAPKMQEEIDFLKKVYFGPSGCVFGHGGLTWQSENYLKGVTYVL